VYAHRVAAGDPYETEFSRDRAYRIRIGFGTGDQVAEGLWSEARSHWSGSDSVSRRSRIDPESVVAEMLSGRRPAYPADDLLLRARLDLDQGRTTQAAIQARAAARALAAELRDADPKEEPPPELAALEALEKSALRGDLDERRASKLEQIVSELERVARRRRHS
jgi:hypothetical protein